MKPILLSLFTGIFSVDTDKTKSKNTTDKIFITSTDKPSGRTIMIEEDDYSVWVYVLKPDFQGIDFDGYLCSIVDPSTLDIGPKEATINGNATPLTAEYANEYSYINDLSSKDIKINWKQDVLEISIKKKNYLVMDLKTKTSYSKALAKDGYYGNSM